MDVQFIDRIINLIFLKSRVKGEEPEHHHQQNSI